MTTVVCDRCQGARAVLVWACDDHGNWRRVAANCPQCDGRGTLVLLEVAPTPRGNNYELRTPATVMRQRRAAGGCCDRYADRKACDCLTDAVACSVCHDPYCDNPCGQH